MISNLLLIEEFFYDFHDIIVDVTYKIFDILCTYSYNHHKNVFLLKTLNRKKPYVKQRNPFFHMIFQFLVFLNRGRNLSLGALKYYQAPLPVAFTDLPLTTKS